MGAVGLFPDARIPVSTFLFLFSFPSLSVPSYAEKKERKRKKDLSCLHSDPLTESFLPFETLLGPFLDFFSLPFLNFFSLPEAEKRERERDGMSTSFSLT